MATTTAAAPKLAALPPARGKASLLGAIASEWTKLRTVRSTYWTIFALIAVSVGLGAGLAAGLASSLNAHPARLAGFDATQVSLGIFLELGPLVIAVLGALVITAEYSTGMIRTSLTVQPRRGVAYAAKALVFAVVALVISFVIAFAAFFIGQSLLSSTGMSATLSHPYVLRAIVGAALYVTLAGLFAFGIGAILRHTAGAITVAIAVLFIVPILANLLPESWNADVVRWLPSSAWQQITTTVGSQTSPHLFGPWPQFGVTAGYVVVLLIIGAVLFKKRDA
jgi:ABC-type transport system involved in multi-copper enzyme maturation permease subunit